MQVQISGVPWTWLPLLDLFPFFQLLVEILRHQFRDLFCCLKVCRSQMTCPYQSMMLINCTLLLWPAKAFLTSHSATFSLNSGFRSSSWSGSSCWRVTGRCRCFNQSWQWWWVLKGAQRGTSIFFCSAGRARILLALTAPWDQTSGQKPDFDVASLLST